MEIARGSSEILEPVGSNVDANGIPKGLSERDFVRLSTFIHSEYGIKIPPFKKTMLETRLQKRLRARGIRSFKDYCEYVFSPDGMKDELVYMIDVVTTNKTDFFREPEHFRFMIERVLPELIRGERQLSIWSAGCATGEEPYTIAMVVSQFLDHETRGGFEFVIYGTDISTRVLATAKEGIYDEERVSTVPLELKRKYLLRSKDKTKKLIRIGPELRARMVFSRLNLMDSDFRFPTKMHVIFCRNVIIYFDRETQENLIRKMYRNLAVNGYLFMGHSETLHGMDVPFVQVAPTVYKKST
ncbi:MAG: Chemotaxis protein methyltransferase [Syntrophorhabdus sp. PtaU1.Bin153]|nr:MAG: Chemotaxis protein methyltransferase [Syntrophorhabdus sp. PtaU1.Bin153]